MLRLPPPPPLPRPPHLSAQHTRVAQHHEAKACACEGDVEAPGVREEADALLLVGAHARHDDDVLLTALKRIHAADLNVLEGMEGMEGREGRQQGRTYIKRDEANTA